MTQISALKAAKRAIMAIKYHSQQEDDIDIYRLAKRIEDDLSSIIRLLAKK